MKFGQRPCTIVQGVWPDFLATLKIHKKSNFDQNQLKLSTSHKDIYNVSENVIKMENYLLAIFTKIWPITLYYSTGTLVLYLSKFKNS